MIGFPDFILDPKELDDVYDGVSTEKQAYLQMMNKPFFNYLFRRIWRCENECTYSLLPLFSVRSD